MSRLTAVSRWEGPQEQSVRDGAASSSSEQGEEMVARHEIGKLSEAGR